MKDYVEKVKAIVKVIVDNNIWEYETKIDKIKQFYTTNETNFAIGLISYSEYGQVNDYINEIYVFLASQN